MPIETIRRFRCPHCQYVTTNTAAINALDVMGCPACGRGEKVDREPVEYKARRVAKHGPFEEWQGRYWENL